LASFTAFDETSATVGRSEPEVPLSGGTLDEVVHLMNNATVGGFCKSLLGTIILRSDGFFKIFFVLKEAPSI
jgi:hypothetical protein